jgi:septal ring factor EnvC (AmiA/AmiB activator)
MTTPRSKNALRLIARWTGSPVWNRIRPRVETIAADRSAQVARQLRAELADLRAELQSNVTDLRSAVAATDERISQVEWTQERLGPQVAAVDERLAVLERPAPANRRNRPRPDPWWRRSGPSTPRCGLDCPLWPVTSTGSPNWNRHSPR